MQRSKEASTAQQEYSRWARETRKDRPPANMDEYIRGWAAFFDHYATTVQTWRKRNAGYHDGLASLFRFHIPPEAHVLEVGSGTGDLLAATRPVRGVGVDISGEMVELARSSYPNLEFRQMAAEHLDLGGETFDYIILSDLTSFLFDIRLVFERLRTVCHPRTRIVMNWYSKLWQPVLSTAERLALKCPQPLLNWTTAEDVQNLLYLTDFEIVIHREHMLLPKRVPLISRFVNRYLAHLPGFRWFCLINWMVVRPLYLTADRPSPSVSVICPCRNEEGNIQQIVERLPAMGSHTELIFVEGHSKDNTLAACRRSAAAAHGRDVTVLVQEGRGKGDAVRLGFAHAKCDIVMILDADLSAAPEDLPTFYETIASGKGEFINGCRLVYTMDPEAMRFLNLLGNRFFAMLLAKLIGQPIRDSLCGTKVLWRAKYEELARGRAYFGDVDPFGDFDLLFGAAKLDLKIAEVPIRYRQRIYGSTNISRFSDGWLLLRMSAKAAAKLFFIPC